MIALKDLKNKPVVLEQYIIYNMNFSCLFTDK